MPPGDFAAAFGAEGAGLKYGLVQGNAIEKDVGKGTEQETEEKKRNGKHAASLANKKRRGQSKLPFSSFLILYSLESNLPA